MVKMKLHPVLGIMVRSDGLILCPPNQLTKDETWRVGGLMSNGYRRVGIKGKTYYVHRLIAETFLPNPENKPFIDHIDRNRANNDVSNLRWATAQENCLNRRTTAPIGQRSIDFETPTKYKTFRYNKWKAKKKLKEK